MEQEKYNIFKENDLSIPRPDSSHSFYSESSTFLRSKRCPEPQSRIGFNFITVSPLSEIRVFFVTVTRRKFPTVYYGFDSTAFCLLRYAGRLQKDRRYMIYGRLTKNKYYFIDCIDVKEIVYRDLCYLLL
jgi:hypothetical protein